MIGARHQTTVRKIHDTGLCYCLNYFSWFERGRAGIFNEREKPCEPPQKALHFGAAVYQNRENDPIGAEKVSHAAASLGYTEIKQ